VTGVKETAAAPAIPPGLGVISTEKVRGTHAGEPGTEKIGKSVSKSDSILTN